MHEVEFGREYQAELSEPAAPANVTWQAQPSNLPTGNPGMHARSALGKLTDATRSPSADAVSNAGRRRAVQAIARSMPEGRHC